MSKFVTIITSNAQLVSDFILEGMHRGYTSYKARGGYTGEEKTIIITVCKRREAYKLKMKIRGADPTAFEHKMLYLPGIVTPTEAMAAIAEGLTTLKFFTGTIFVCLIFSRSCCSVIFFLQNISIFFNYSTRFSVLQRAYHA